MNKKKIEENQADETKETPNQKFHRIVNHRTQLLGKAYNLITRIPPQPTYEVTPEDATKLISWVNEYHELFLKRYTPIANGEKISRSGEKQLKEVF